MPYWLCSNSWNPDDVDAVVAQRGDGHVHAGTAVGEAGLVAPRPRVRVAEDVVGRDLELERLGASLDLLDLPRDAGGEAALGGAEATYGLRELLGRRVLGLGSGRRRPLLRTTVVAPRTAGVVRGRSPRRRWSARRPTGRWRRRRPPSPTRTTPTPRPRRPRARGTGPTARRANGAGCPRCPSSRGPCASRPPSAEVSRRPRRTTPRRAWTAQNLKPNRVPSPRTNRRRVRTRAPAAGRRPGTAAPGPSRTPAPAGRPASASPGWSGRRPGWAGCRSSPAAAGRAIRRTG